MRKQLVHFPADHDRLVSFALAQNTPLDTAPEGLLKAWFESFDSATLRDMQNFLQSTPPIRRATKCPPTLLPELSDTPARNGRWF
jgi:hypothetical protein